MLQGDLHIIETYARNLHLVSLALCFLLVALADSTAAKSMFKSLKDADFQRLHRCHSLLTKGLIVFWLTGIFLVWQATSFEWANFSPKLIAKILVVTLLTANAWMIGRLAMPHFERNRGMTFGEFHFSARMGLAICAGLSSASWFSAFCLGAIKWLKTASAIELAEFLLPIYGVCLAGAGMVALLSVFSRLRVTTPDPMPILATSRPLSQNTVFPAE